MAFFQITQNQPAKSLAEQRFFRTTAARSPEDCRNCVSRENETPAVKSHEGFANSLFKRTGVAAASLHGLRLRRPQWAYCRSAEAANLRSKSSAEHTTPRRFANRPE
jgi:hypothetical protein